MKRLTDCIFAAALAACLAGCSSAPDTDQAGRGTRAITPDMLRNDVTYLASDAMMGRNTPSPELDTAASYIAAELHKAGIAPVNGSYFQKVSLNIIALGKQNSLSITKDGKQQAYSLKTDFVPFEMTANRTVTAPVVFAGYGITAPEYGYDDYKDIDVKGKIVLVLRHEPGEEDPSSKFGGTKTTTYANTDTKVRTAVAHGAVGMIVVTDPLNHGMLTPRGFPWPSLSTFIPADALPITLGSDEAKKIPVIHAGSGVIEQLFGAVDSLKALQRSIDGSLTPHSFDLHATAQVATSTEIRDRSSRNVVGMVEGSDPALQRQIVIAGAHYDHVGFKKNHEPGEDYIYNGADDNASGTSGVLAVARAIGSLGVKPKRTVVFLFFCGEEEGLLGSTSYTKEPLFPLDSTVAMLNLDMIGRNGADTLYEVGSSKCPDLARLNEEENRSIGFKILYNQEQYLASSDQASFLQAGVPVIFLNTGEHQDYHKVSDEASKINYNKAAAVARLAFLDVWRIANEAARFAVPSQYVRPF